MRVKRHALELTRKTRLEFARICPSLFVDNFNKDIPIPAVNGAKELLKMDNPTGTKKGRGVALPHSCASHAHS